MKLMTMTMIDVDLMRCAVTPSSRGRRACLGTARKGLFSGLPLLLWVLDMLAS